MANDKFIITQKMVFWKEHEARVHNEAHYLATLFLLIVADSRCIIKKLEPEYTQPF